MQSSESKTLITGVIGSDCHIVGTRILSMALEKAGYDVVSLGALTPSIEFVNAAVETDADAILVSSLYGQGELDCRGFRDICIEAGIGGILIYVGGNVVVGKQDWREVERRFLDRGRLLGSGQAPSTVESDVSLGFTDALQILHRRLPKQPRYRYRLACSSAAGGLRLITRAWYAS